MKVTLEELIRIDSALGKVLSAPLPIKTAFKFNKLVHSLRTDVKAMEKTRKDLITQFSDPVEGGRLVLREEDREEFEKAHKELLTEEIEIDFKPIPISELVGVKLSATEAFDLEKFIKV